MITSHDVITHQGNTARHEAHKMIANLSQRESTWRMIGFG